MTDTAHVSSVEIGRAQRGPGPLRAAACVVPERNTTATPPLRWVCLLLGLLATGLLASPALALSYFDGTSVVECPQTGFLIGKVVPCVQLAVQSATAIFLDAFSQAMFPVTLAFLTLAIVLFGVQVASGFSEVKQRSFGILIKIGLVLTFADNLGGFAPDIFAIMEELQEVVTRQMDFNEFSCFNNRDAGVDTSQFIFNAGPGVIWGRLDCMIDRLFGLGGATMFNNGLFAFISAAIFGGAMGISAFSMTGLALLSVIFFVFRAVLAYLTSYIYVGFLIIISPMLIMFIALGSTASYLDRWVRAVMAGMAMPTLMFAFLAISMPILDHMVFAHQDSFQQQFGDRLQDMYRNNQQFCSRQTHTDQEFYNNMDSSGNYIVGEWGKNALAPIMGGGTDTCGAFSFNNLDMAAQNGKIFDHMSRMIELFDDVIRIAITALILATVMGGIQTLVVSMFGGAPLNAANDLNVSFLKTNASSGLRGLNPSGGAPSGTSAATSVGSVLRGGIT